MKNWKELSKDEPKIENYYTVKYEDGSIDEKWWRNRPSKNIKGFLVDKKVTHWK